MLQQAVRPGGLGTRRKLETTLVDHSVEQDFLSMMVWSFILLGIFDPILHIEPISAQNL